MPKSAGRVWPKLATRTATHAFRKENGNGFSLDQRVPGGRDKHGVGISATTQTNGAMALPQISVVGSLNMDLVSYVPHCPRAGETLTATSFAVSPGGKGANQAVACAKLSRSPPSRGDGTGPTAMVSMLGAVGDDGYGAAVRANLAAHGVDVSGVRAREGLKTGLAIIVVEAATGENRIILSPEANHSHGADDYAAVASLGGAAPPDLLILQLEIPLPTVLGALGAAKRAGVRVLLNPAPAVAELPADAMDGLDHLVMNETEAAILSGEPAADEGEMAPDRLARVARSFVEKGVHNVVITLGARGVYYANRAGETDTIPAERAAVVDTTAAGDTFVGQYALEVVSTPPGAPFDMAAAVKKANRAAAKTVERKGAQDSIPWRDELSL